MSLVVQRHRRHCLSERHQKTNRITHSSSGSGSGSTAARDLCPHLGIPALLCEIEGGLRRWIAPPVAGDDAQRSEHFRRRRLEFWPARPVCLRNDEAQEPDESLGVVLLGDDANAHRAQLRIQLALVDTLSDQLDASRRTTLLCDGKACEHNSVVRIRQRAHDRLVALRGGTQQKSYRLASHQRLRAIQKYPRGEACRQRGEFPEE